MADAIVSVVLDQLGSIFSQQIQAKITLVAGVDEEVRTLTSNFRAIRAVLEDAENRQVKEETVRSWLEKLKDASYDIDDVLDEWNTEIQKLRMKKPENGSNGKVRFLIPSCCFSPSWQVFLRHDIASKIKNLNKTLDDIAKEKERYDFRSMTSTKELVRPMTTSFSNEQTIYGREQDIHRIRNFLFEERSQGPNIPIISIIGIGGLGKTALARQVFNDDEVQSYFNVKIWVCVSDPFDEVRIAKAILTSLEGVATNLIELQDLLQDIHHSIKEKKFLLVLDDVWTEDFKNWEQLMGSFKSASQESRILVTTRKEHSAEIINTDEKILLGKLSKDECWSLFSQIAFSEITIEDERFKDIGRKIVNKCDGLPLALKSLGGLLKSKTKIKQWQNVLDDEIWNLENVEEQIFLPLLLSYFDLPSKLKKCFLYCAIFPKDYEIEKNKLIRLWMAQGYLKVDHRKYMELIGEEYFQNLAMRSFFQDFQRIEYNDTITLRCKMHDIVHDVALFLTKNECSFIENDGGANSQLKFSCENARHLMIKKKSIPNCIYNGKKLRSFVVVKNFINLVSEIDLSKLLEQLTFLRTLSLSLSVEEIPKKIKNLIHLRYLNLSYSCKLIELPVTLCELYNLETLDLEACESLQKLPKEIRKLIHLKYLNLSRCIKLKELSETLCELYNLETLNLHCCESLQKVPKEIGKLIHLKYLNLSICRNLTELPKTLCELCNLEVLDVSGCNLEKLPQEIGKLINLRQLKNSGMDGLSYMPKGMESLTALHTLSEFVVSGCNRGTEEACTLEALKNLSHLEGSLELRGLGNVTNISEVVKGELKNKKNLTDLSLRFDMEEVEEAEEEDEEEEEEERMVEYHKVVLEALEPPPDLETLTIRMYKGKTMCTSWMISLTKLKKLSLLAFHNCELPPLAKLSSLEILVLDSFWKVERMVNEFMGIENDATSSSSPIIGFPKLKELYIGNMHNWEDWNYEITSEDITTMPCLHSLTIINCNKLRALPEQLLQSTTLKQLWIAYCPLLNSEKLRVFSYRGNTIFPNLTNLILEGDESSCLPLGKLPSLESLQISRMKSVKGGDTKVLGMETNGTPVVTFPKLKNLVIFTMEEWEEWDVTNEDEDVEIMPCLHSLTISECKKLQALPDHILQKPTLKKLDITNCSILFERYNKETGKEWPKISHIPNVYIW